MSCSQPIFCLTVRDELYSANWKCCSILPITSVNLKTDRHPFYLRRACQALLEIRLPHSASRVAGLFAKIAFRFAGDEHPGRREELCDGVAQADPGIEAFHQSVPFIRTAKRIRARRKAILYERGQS